MRHDTRCFHSEKAFKPACRLNLWEDADSPPRPHWRPWSWISPFCRALQACQGKLYCSLCYSPGGLSIETCSESCSNWIEFRNWTCGSEGLLQVIIGKPVSSQVSLLECPPHHQFHELPGGGGWGGMKRWFSAWGLGFLPLLVISRDKSGCSINEKPMNTKIQNMDRSS